MPLKPDGEIDRDAIKDLFMASPYLDWVRFAEEQGWDALFTRRQLPAKTWIKEKRDFLAEKQMDILSGIIHERKYKWTHEIIKTLDEYPVAIDMGLQLTKFKMGQIGEMYKDYVENFRGKQDAMFYKGKRRYHPFEKLSAQEISLLTKALKDLTEAKLKALMLDKWAIAKFDVPLDEPMIEEGEAGFGPKFTIEGKEVTDVKDLQNWFDQWHDKPKEPIGDGGS